MKKYYIWREGFRTSGMERNEKAMFLGCSKAESFREACEKWYNTLYGIDRTKTFDKKNLTYWACRLFDNESDARKSFG